MFGFLLTSFVFTAVPLPPRQVRNEPYGSSIQTRQCGKTSPLEKAIDRFGVVCDMPDFEQNQISGWSIKLSYNHASGSRVKEILDLSPIMRALPDDTHKKYFYSNLKVDIAVYLSTLYNFVTKYREPKKAMIQRNERLKMFNRVLNWGGAALGSVLAGTTSYSSAFITTVTSTVIASGGEILATYWKGELDLAFKQREKADAVLGTILSRYSKQDPICFMFRNMARSIIGYENAEEYSTKLPKAWSCGLAKDFPDQASDYTAVPVAAGSGSGSQ